MNEVGRSNLEYTRKLGDGDAFKFLRVKINMEFLVKVDWATLAFRRLVFLMLLQAVRGVPSFAFVNRVIDRQIYRGVINTFL